MAIQFGILTTAKTSLTSIMIIHSVKLTDEDTFTEANDEAGEVTAVNQTTRPKTIEVEGLITGTAPTSGAELSIDSITYQIRTVETGEENEGFKTLSLSGVEKVWS